MAENTTEIGMFVCKDLHRQAAWIFASQILKVSVKGNINVKIEELCQEQLCVHPAATQST